MDTNPQHEPWHDRWKSGRIAFHRSDVHPMLEYFWPRLDLRGDERVLVPLAGKSLDMRWLAARGHDVVGVELSAIAARQFFEEAREDFTVESRDGFAIHSHGRVAIWVGDVFALTPSHLAPIEAFYDRASVVALDPPTRRRYAQHLASLVPARAQGLMIALESMTPDEQGPPFSVTQAEVGALFEDAFEREILLEPNPESAPEVRALFEHVHRLRRRDA